MKMNSKITGIVFLLVCLLIVLFIGQWMYLGKSTQPMYFGAMGPVREGATSKDVQPAQAQQQQVAKSANNGPQAVQRNK